MRICTGTYAGRTLPVSDATQEETPLPQTFASKSGSSHAQGITSTKHADYTPGRPCKTDGTYAGLTPNITK